MHRASLLIFFILKIFKSLDGDGMKKKTQTLDGAVTEAMTIHAHMPMVAMTPNKLLRTNCHCFLPQGLVTITWVKLESKRHRTDGNQKWPIDSLLDWSVPLNYSSIMHIFINIHLQLKNLQNTTLPRVIGHTSPIWISAVQGLPYRLNHLNGWAAYWIACWISLKNIQTSIYLRVHGVNGIIFQRGFSD